MKILIDKEMTMTMKNNLQAHIASKLPDEKLQLISKRVDSKVSKEKMYAENCYYYEKWIVKYLFIIPMAIVILCWGGENWRILNQTMSAKLPHSFSRSICLIVSPWWFLSLSLSPSFESHAYLSRFSSFYIFLIFFIFLNYPSFHFPLYESLFSATHSH